MLSDAATPLAHAGAPATWHDAWSSWHLDPVVLGFTLVGLVVAVRAARATARRSMRRRATWFALGTLAAALAVVSPLDALSSSLASAHMVQHVVLLLVAAPLLALASPHTLVAAATPRALQRVVARWRRNVGIGGAGVLDRHAVAVWLLAVAPLWIWHAAGPYTAAVEHGAVHAVQHATFLVTTTVFWSVALRAPARTERTTGLPVLLVFAMAVQGVVLSMLLTFAEDPWYDVYATTTRAFGLEPLEDQRLAGAIMWVPAGALQVGVGLALFVRWVRAADDRVLGVHEPVRP